VVQIGDPSIATVAFAALLQRVVTRKPAMSTPSLKLYRFALSGHSHRAELALSLMRLPHTLVDVDLMKGAHKTPQFLQMNPFGQVPVLDDDGTTVFDSNAILVYLGARFDRDGRWLPREPRALAAVQGWLSAAAGPLAFGPAAARLISLFGSNTVFGSTYDARDVVARAHGLLGVMEHRLGQGPFLADERATLADVAMYSYTVSAPEGNVDLAPYRRVRDWLARLEALPGFVPFQKTAVGLAA
jgi:glutathione S-transferase